MLRETKLILGGGTLLVLVFGISVAVLVVTVVDFNGDKEFPEFETVSTFNGRLRGRLHRTFFDDKPYYAFKGIPYAKPPILELRFKVSFFCSCTFIDVTDEMVLLFASHHKELINGMVSVMRSNLDQNVFKVHTTAMKTVCS